jgi:hypothetical protein
MIPHRAFGNPKPIGNGLIRLALKSKNLKCHDFFPGKFRASCSVQKKHGPDSQPQTQFQNQGPNFQKTNRKTSGSLTHL